MWIFMMRIWIRTGIKINIEQNLCAMVFKGCGAAFLYVQES